jgi:SAM-dependent methyltransferase
VRLSVIALAMLAAFAQTEASVGSTQQTSPARKPDVIFVGTEPAVVRAMLTLAKVTKRDVVYDLGCGDGRIPIAAAKMYGARGVGIDIDPSEVAIATAAAKAGGVSDKVTFKVGDIFDPALTFTDATVVTLFLLPELNLRLQPRLQHELKPGTRVVSNSFDMGGTWLPDKTEQVGNFAIYLWIVR